MSVLLAVAAVSADGRTALKPGWNMFSPKQDVEVRQRVAPDAERQLAMLKNSRSDDYVNDLAHEFQRYEGTFHEMLRSVRVKP